MYTRTYILTIAAYPPTQNFVLKAYNIPERYFRINYRQASSEELL